MYMAWGFRVPVYPKISATSTTLAVLNNLARNPYAAGLAIDGEDGGTGAAYNVSMDHMGHPIASNIRDCYLNLVAIGRQNEIPLFAGGGIGKTGNLAANAAALIMLGASGIQIGKYIMQAGAGSGSRRDFRPGIRAHRRHRARPRRVRFPGSLPGVPGSQPSRGIGTGEPGSQPSR
jgi:glutamate synthase (NADPH/NADH) large chain